MDTLNINQAYIAVTKDGFVDGACFTQSEDSDSWFHEMKESGFIVKNNEKICKG